MVVRVNKEKAIAEKYAADFPLLMTIWGIAGPSIWLALWPLIYFGYMPLWVGGIIATIIMAYTYLPCHEAEHGNIGRPNSRLRWLNELIGHANGFIITLPYSLHRTMHMKHHAYTNEPGKDPDTFMSADNVWQALRKGVDSLQPGRPTFINVDLLDDTPKSKQLILEAFFILTLTWAGITLLAWTGFALEVLILWWLPSRIAGIYIMVTQAWFPHHPGTETGRYRSTQGRKIPFGLVLTGGMEYHLVHHLFPTIPLNRTPAAYRELKPLLKEKGMELNNL